MFLLAEGERIPTIEIDETRSDDQVGAFARPERLGFRWFAEIGREPRPICTRRRRFRQWRIVSNLVRVDENKLTMSEVMPRVEVRGGVEESDEAAALGHARSYRGGLVTLNPRSAPEQPQSFRERALETAKYMLEHIRGIAAGHDEEICMSGLVGVIAKVGPRNGDEILRPVLGRDT
jgi:hypothetical protein